jgi:hypothetical protein
MSRFGSAKIRSCPPPAPLLTLVFTPALPFLDKVSRGRRIGELHEKGRAGDVAKLGG